MFTGVSRLWPTQIYSSGCRKHVRKKGILCFQKGKQRDSELKSVKQNVRLREQARSVSFCMNPEHFVQHAEFPEPMSLAAAAVLRSISPFICNLATSEPSSQREARLTKAPRIALCLLGTLSSVRPYQRGRTASPSICFHTGRRRTCVDPIPRVCCSG